MTTPSARARKPVGVGQSRVDDYKAVDYYQAVDDYQAVNEEDEGEREEESDSPKMLSR